MQHQQDGVSVRTGFFSKKTAKQELKRVFLFVIPTIAHSSYSCYSLLTRVCPVKKVHGVPSAAQN